MENLKDILVIVSGIPRSGTSLLMQMLQAGGMEILSDEKRKADNSNPKGYFELETIKSLYIDNSCLKGQFGKAVKVISYLLKYLPEDQKYKIIFINRDMDEIIKSQQKMLGRDEKKPPKALINAFDKEIRNVKIWAENNPNIEILYLHYTNVIENSKEEINKIINFLNIPLNKEKMIDVIDPHLSNI